MKDREPLNEKDQADLVAFLDGELRGEVARKIEQRIIADPRVRAEAEVLKQTWDLLDFLPQPEPSTHFTQQTLERLPALRQPWLEGLWPDWNWRDILVGTGGILIAFTSGFLGYRLLANRPAPGEAELLRELRLIENKRFYDRALNLQFLQGLDQPDLFGAGVNDS